MSQSAHTQHLGSNAAAELAFGGPGPELLSLSRGLTICVGATVPVLKPAQLHGFQLSGFAADSLPHSTATLQDLVTAVKSAVVAEKLAGFELGPCKQDRESCCRLCSTVVAALQAYSISNCGDWHRFANFCDQHFVRNLVYWDEDIEVMVLCWQPGQVSRVHNHSSSHCFLAPLHNAVREERYEIATEMTSPRAAASRAGVPASHAMSPFAASFNDAVGTSAAAASSDTMNSPIACPPLTHLGGADMQVGEVGYINDCMALHSIGNTTCPMGASTAACDGGGGLHGGLGGGGAVTLHVYCPPIRRVRLYEEEDDAAASHHRANNNHGGDTTISAGCVTAGAAAAGGRVVVRVPGYHYLGNVMAQPPYQPHSQHPQQVHGAAAGMPREASVMHHGRSTSGDAFADDGTGDARIHMMNGSSGGRGDVMLICPDEEAGLDESWCDYII